MAKFGEALEKIKDGNRAKRQNWEDKYIALLNPGPEAPMSEPYIYQSSNDKQEPWAPSHTELLAEDWEGV